MLWAFALVTLTPRALFAVADPALLKAKSEAEAKGYIFETSRDDILAKARKEGRVKILSGWGRDLFPYLREAFKKKYPFIDVHIEETAGIDAAQRNTLEVKSGGARGWDIVNNHPDFYSEMAPHFKKFDILGMARHGILGIPLPMIDPVNRNIIEVGSQVQVLAFNKKLIAPEKVPASWQGLLGPEFKEKKFALDMRPTQIASLIPAWGLEKTIEFARKLAAQNPIWVRGGERNVTSVASGEFQVFLAPNYSTVRRAQAKDPTRALDFKVLEPVPTRLSKSPGLLAVAEHPYAALLWLEFEASPEAQKIADKHEPYGASIYVPGSALEELTRGKRLSVIDWSHFHKMKQYQEKIVEAYGFPKAGK
ncbi:MAG TPA: ABC transporter substrate-binding protein [Candidatus Acidoferrales bacterium]|nr:ABC transporter substrate-binding protein [Candidatus Acidoferrales bacterium]